MEIKNPILRYLAGFAVFALLLATLVFFLHGIGSFMEPWYAQEYPNLYESAGYSFIDSVVTGLLPVIIIAVVGVCFAGVFLAVRGIGNRFLGPPVEDATEE